MFLGCNTTQSGGNLLAFRSYLLPPTTTLKMEVAHSSPPTVSFQHNSNSILDEIYWPFSADYLKNSIISEYVAIVSQGSNPINICKMPIC
jgi:hypothetical protein